MHTNPTTRRTTSDDNDFRALVVRLDMDLAQRNGEANAFFAAHNELTPLAQVVVVLQGGIPLGCGAFKPFDHGAVEIKRMYTAPEHRQRGIGSLVLHELERWAQELGHARCVLETGRMMPEAIGLYQKRGYLRIPNYGPYAGVESSVCFEKRL